MPVETLRLLCLAIPVIRALKSRTTAMWLIVEVAHLCVLRQGIFRCPEYILVVHRGHVLPTGDPRCSCGLEHLGGDGVRRSHMLNMSVRVKR